MFPNQLQFRELILQTLIGLLFFLIVISVILDFSPGHTAKILTTLIKNPNIIGSWVIMPIIIFFALAYVAGTCISNFAGTRLNHKNASVAVQNFLTPLRAGFVSRIKKLVLKYILGIESTDSMNVSLLLRYDPITFTEILPQKIENTWCTKVDRPITQESIHNYFGLCGSYVECNAPSNATVNIERHYVAMLFNARLTFIFLLLCIVAGLEFLNSIFTIFPTYTSFHFSIWLLAVIVFWLQARSAANRTFISGFARTHLIYLAFINYSILNGGEKSD